jgi:hypothetical protein
MSHRLLDLISQFLERKIPVSTFVDGYVDGWRGERNSGELLKDDPVVSETLSSAFCIVDLYDPTEDREDYEFDEVQLRIELEKLMTGEKP